MTWVGGGVGKLVRGALYLHESALPRLDEGSRLLVARAAGLAGGFAWNVARIEPDDVVGLLDYPEFDGEAFPCLAAAARVSLTDQRVRITRYAHSANPLVLHRKELLVDEDHPRRPAWAETTQRVLRAGILQEGNRIGRLVTWTALLTSAGLDAQGEKTS